MATDYSSRASMDNAWNCHGSENGKPRTERKLNTLQESQRKTEGPGATAFYAKKNRFVVPEDTHKNYDFVNDGDGGFREATSVDETLDYGEYRVNRVKSKLADSNTTWITSVFHLPYDLCEEIPNYYPRLDDNGKQMINPDGTPAMRSRWVIAEGKEDEARRCFDEVLKFFGDRVLAGGQAGIHGGSINLDESRPHMQIISDQFEADERSKDPDALKNGFSLAMGRHPRKSRRVPKFDKRTGEPIMLPDGTQKHGPEDASEKAERHHRELKQHMLDAGFNIESERDAKRHNRRLDNHDFQSLRDREANTDERTAAAEEATVDAEVARYEIEGREEAALLDQAEAAETTEWLTDAWVEQEEPELRERAESEGYEVGQEEARLRYRAAKKKGWQEGRDQAKEYYAETVDEGNAYLAKRKAELDGAKAKIAAAEDKASAKAQQRWDQETKPKLVEQFNDEANTTWVPKLRAKAKADGRSDAKAEAERMVQERLDAAEADRTAAAKELEAARTAHEDALQKATEAFETTERPKLRAQAKADGRADAKAEARAELQAERDAVAADKDTLTDLLTIVDGLVTEVEESASTVSETLMASDGTFRTLRDMGMALPKDQQKKFFEVTQSRFGTSVERLRALTPDGKLLNERVTDLRSSVEAARAQLEDDDQGNGNGKPKGGGDPQPGN